MNRDEGVEDVKSNVDGFPVPEVGRCRSRIHSGKSPATYSRMRHQPPKLRAVLVGPEHLDDVRVVDFAKLRRSHGGTASYPAAFAKELELCSSRPQPRHALGKSFEKPLLPMTSRISKRPSIHANNGDHIS